MRENGVQKNSVKLVYKIHIFTLLLITLSTTINFIFNIICRGETVFATSLYLVLIPVFNYNKTGNIFEIIIFALLLSITVAILIKQTKDYYSLNKRKYMFGGITLFWCLLSSIFSEVAYNIDTSEKISTPNIIFFIAYTVFQLVVVLLKMFEYAKYLDEKKKNINPNTNPHYKTRSLTSIKNVLYLSAVLACCAIILCYVIRFLGVVSIFLFSALYIYCGIFISYLAFINLRDFKKIRQSGEASLCTDKIYKKLVVSHILIFLLFLISYLILFFMCM